MALSSRGATTGRWIKIGTLLLKAGVITPEAFAQSLERSKQGDTLVGSILVRQGWVKHEELSAALYLQSLLAEGLLAPELAIKALTLVAEQGATPQAALNTLGWKPAIQPQVDEIEYLLTEPGFISRQLYYSIVSKTKSAFSLVLKGTLRCNQFNEVLKAVSLVRANVCNLEQATIALRSFKTTAVPIEDTLRRTFGIAIRKTSFRLGELLVNACILSEADVLMALEKSLRSHTQLGVCLMSGTALSPTALDVCLEIQSLEMTGVIDGTQAAKMAKQCVDLKSTLGDYLTRHRPLQEDAERSAMLVELLTQSEVIDTNDLVEANTMTHKYCMGPIASLAATQRIDRQTYKAVWYFDEQMRRGELRFEQAVVAMMWCQRTGGEAEEAANHVSGRHPARTSMEEHQSPAKHEVSELQRLTTEAAKMQTLIEEETGRNHRLSFVAGCILGCALLGGSVLFLNGAASAGAIMAVAVGFVAYLVCLALHRRQQLKTGQEQSQFSAKCAVRTNRRQAIRQWRHNHSSQPRQ
jgi:hypothetical protein